MRTLFSLVLFHERRITPGVGVREARKFRGQTPLIIFPLEWELIGSLQAIGRGWCVNLTRVYSVC